MSVWANIQEMHKNEKDLLLYYCRWDFHDYARLQGVIVWMQTLFTSMQ
jgi:hypothetical protein